MAAVMQPMSSVSGEETRTMPARPADLILLVVLTVKAVSSKSSFPLPHASFPLPQLDLTLFPSVESHLRVLTRNLQKDNDDDLYEGFDNPVASAMQYMNFESAQGMSAPMQAASILRAQEKQHGRFGYSTNGNCSPKARDCTNWDSDERFQVAVCSEKLSCCRRLPRRRGSKTHDVHQSCWLYFTGKARIGSVGMNAFASAGAGAAPPLVEISVTCCWLVCSAGYLQEKKDNSSPEDEARDLEKKVNKLLEDSAIARSENKLQLALDQAKEAARKERQLGKLREQKQLMDQMNIDLTYAVYFNLATQLEANEYWPEALNSYSLIVKNKQYTNAGRLRINIGNIYFKQQKFPAAIKMYRMALDQIPNSGEHLRFKIMRNIGNAFVRMGNYKVRAGRCLEVRLSQLDRMRSCRTRRAWRENQIFR
eukprot:764673-Hanusia_phi.AAC.3